MIGERLLHFEITCKLGEGGMGEVYRATDSKLGREVAIKVLPESFAADEERLARFEREAKVLASLSHPNIAGIFEVGEQDGTHFLAMELAEGEDLAARIVRGPLPHADAIEIARQIAVGLEAAHEQGIVHRDLKPANVKITEEGPDGLAVKILDFGLAKALAEESRSGPDFSMSPTLTAQKTQAGVILGTAAYMSPEQARGKAVDKRADIWAFGAVLFEMLTGTKPFAAEDTSLTLAAIMKDEPDWALLPAATPPTLSRLLRRCLEKDPRKRLRDIGEARIVLEGSDGIEDAPLSAAVAPPEDSAWRRVLPWGIAAIAVVVALGLGLDRGAGSTDEDSAEPWQTVIRTEPLYTVTAPIIAPDGRSGVYSTGGGMGMWRLDRFEHRSWEGLHFHPFYSPDGEHLGFEKEGALWRMNIATGEARRIGELPGFNLSGAVWSNDDIVTFITWFPQKLYRLPAEGGEIEELGGPFEHRLELVGSLPDGRGLLFVNLSEGGVEILSEGAWTSVLSDSDIVWAAWSPTGHILYHEPDTGLWAVPFSLEQLAPTAGPVQLDPIGTWPTVSNGGRLSYRRGLDRNRFVLTNRNGEIQGPIGRGQFMLQDPSVSPDGKTVTGVSRDQGRFAVWQHEMGSEVARRLTFELEPSLGSAAWSPDGRYLYFATDAEVWRLDLEGKEPPEVVAEGHIPHVSPDGRFLVFSRGIRTDAAEGVRNYAIHYLDLTAGSEPDVFLESASPLTRVRFSPDGRYVAYVSRESGRSEIFVRRFPSGGGPWQVSNDGGREPRWSPAGDELFYLRPGLETRGSAALFPGRDLMAVEVSTGDTFRSGETRSLFTLSSPTFYEYSVTPDGQFVVVHPGEDWSEIAVVDDWEQFFGAADR